MDENKLKSVCKKEAMSVRPGKVFRVKMTWRVFRKGVSLYLSRPAAQFKFATSFGMIVIMMSGGVSAYAYDSPEVNAASMLYPVKQGLEGIERRFKASPEDQIRFHIKIAKRRLSETEAMNDRLNRMMESMGPMGPMGPMGSMAPPPPPELSRLNQAIELTMERMSSEVDKSLEFTDVEMNAERARELIRDMQDDFAMMHNHMGMMHDGDTMEQLHEQMAERLQLMQQAASQIEQVEPRGKRIRLREILIVQPTGVEQPISSTQPSTAGISQ